MELENAIKNVTAILEAYRGTKGEHVTLEQSLKTILENLKKDEPKKVK
jgi:hypothetical protein